MPGNRFDSFALFGPNPGASPIRAVNPTNDMHPRQRGWCVPSVCSTHAMASRQDAKARQFMASRQDAKTPRPDSSMGSRCHRTPRTTLVHELAKLVLMHSARLARCRASGAGTSRRTKCRSRWSSNSHCTVSPASSPRTSVGLNRNFQAIFRAPIARALDPEAWELWQHGSVCHAEHVPHEDYGIWGQTLAARIDTDGTMRVLLPSRHIEGGAGTIGSASGPWSQPLRESGFTITAHGGRTVSLTRAACEVFDMEAEVVLRSGTARLTIEREPVRDSLSVLRCEDDACFESAIAKARNCAECPSVRFGSGLSSPAHHEEAAAGVDYRGLGV